MGSRAACHYYVCILMQIVSRETNGDGITRILEATGSDQVISGMFSLLRKGGQITMVGLPKTALHVENASHNIGIGHTMK